MNAPTAYPLSWPKAWPRTPPGRRMPPRWQVAIESNGTKKRHEIRLGDARERLSAELDKLGGRYAVLSSNIELRLDGQPRAGLPEPDDTGAAVYFQLRGKPIVLACDRWNTVAGNLAAIAAHIGAMRGMDRWGVGSIEQMFNGYAMLPAPLVPDDWRATLLEPTTLESAVDTYKRLMKECNGSGPRAYTLNAAIERARKELTV